MTVGEKIQFYRKKSGLSQEALGQKMLVSRQTVSLWEMDKTLPTIDNLLRLKEIFSVSIDDILSDTEPSEGKTDGPKEAYVFHYDQADLNKVYKHTVSPLTRSVILFTLCFGVLWLLLAWENNSHSMLFFPLGCFLMNICFCIKEYLTFRKTWKHRDSQILQRTYSYEVFDQYILLKISRNEEITRTQKIYFDDIESVQTFDNYLIFQIAGQTYIIKKDALVPYSAFFTIFNKVLSMKNTKEPKKLLKIISVLLSFLSVCTVLGAMYAFPILSALNQSITQNKWVFFASLPIPLASIIFGFYLKKKGYKYKINVILGFIMAALLFLFGSFTFNSVDEVSYSDEPLLNAEQALNIDFPTHDHITTTDRTKGPQTSSHEYAYYTSYIHFDSSSVEEFEKEIKSDPRWISDISVNMLGIVSFFLYPQTGNYYIIYNKDTNEFNQLPSKSGTYVFISVQYNPENNSMGLVEYEIEYHK